MSICLSLCFYSCISVIEIMNIRKCSRVVGMHMYVYMHKRIRSRGRLCSITLNIFRIGKIPGGREIKQLCVFRGAEAVGRDFEKQISTSEPNLYISVLQSSP